VGAVRLKKFFFDSAMREAAGFEVEGEDDDEGEGTADLIQRPDGPSLA
jgi:hypothetical protein